MAGEFVHGQDTSGLRKREVTPVTRLYVFKPFIIITIRRQKGVPHHQPLWKKTSECNRAVTKLSIRFIRKSSQTDYAPGPFYCWS